MHFEQPPSMAQSPQDHTERSDSEQQRDLEEIAPGASEYLKNSFHIKNLGRYPATVLAALYEQREQPGDWGVLIYPEHDDNDAFRTDQKAIAELAEAVGATHRLRIVECGSVGDIVSVLGDLTTTFGPASFAAICGHGNSESIHLGDGSQESSITIGNLRNQFGDALDTCLAPDAEICLVSCSTGAEAGIGEHVSDTLGRTVHGPDEDAGFQSFGAMVSGKKVSFSPVYTGSNSRRIRPGNLVAGLPLSTAPNESSAEA